MNAHRENHSTNSINFDPRFALLNFPVNNHRLIEMKDYLLLCHNKNKFLDLITHQIVEEFFLDKVVWLLTGCEFPEPSDQKCFEGEKTERIKYLSDSYIPLYLFSLYLNLEDFLRKSTEANRNVSNSVISKESSSSFQNNCPAFNL
jgi:hypothetical protein